MPQSSKRHRTPINTNGLKLFITAASLTATAGGWALYARHDAPQAVAPLQIDQGTTSVEQAGSQQSILQIAEPVLPALPTLIPAPDAAVGQVLLQNQLQDKRDSQSRTQIQTRPTPTVAPAPAKQPPLRSVQPPTIRPNRAPAPVTSSRSSRP